MFNARDGPTLRSTEGIDSLHLELSVNYADLKRFCNEGKLKFIREKTQNSKWQTVYRIFLAGERITATYISKSKCTRFEFFSLCNYSKNTKQLELIQALMYYFSDRDYAISRLDYTVDINIKVNDINPVFKDLIPVYNHTTIYFNHYTNGKTKKRLSTLSIYDKARQIHLYSTPITRVEIRLFREELSRKRLMKMFEEENTMMQTSNLLYALLETQLKLYMVNENIIYKIRTNTLTTLKNFLEFLHGNAKAIQRPDLFNTSSSLLKSKKILDWMKQEGIVPNEVMKYIGRKKMAVCKELQIDVSTFDKAISYFTAPESEL